MDARLSSDRDTAAPAPRFRLPRDRMALLFLVMLVTAAGNTAMQSVMPSIGTRLRVDDVWISLAYSWSGLLWTLCAPHWARRSDRRGRKAMMRLGLVSFAVSFGLCALVLLAGLQGFISATATLLLFAIARAIYGAFGSAAPPAVQAYVASRTSRADRTRALALVASSFGLGTVLGPAVAPLLIVPGLGLVSPFVWFALFALVVVVALRLRLPDDDPNYAARGEVMAAPFSASSNPRVVTEDPHGWSDELPAADPPADTDGVPRLRWADRRLRPWLIAGALGGHAQAIVLGVIGFMLLDRLGLRAEPEAAAGPIGLVLMSGAVATLLAQWGLIPMLDLSSRAATLWGVALASVGVAVLASAEDLHGIAVGFAIGSVGFGLYRPGFTAGASLAVTRAEQGQAAGIVAAVNGSAYVVAPAIGVWLYNHWEWLAWGLVEALCLAVIVFGWKSLATAPGREERPA